MTRKRIAIAGFQHETNTFAPSQADLEAFTMADSWPGLLAGEQVLTDTRGMNLPVAGAVLAADAMDDVELVPILWCSAEPSGPVTTDAFDRISDNILQGLQQAGRIDGLYLDLHGAMVTEEHDDGEAALVAKVRQMAGPELPIGISLDLHANLSAELVALADVITIYRTYPHLDMAQTGARCLHRLLRCIEGTQLHAAFRQPPFLVPLPAQFTGGAPCDRLYGQVAALPENGNEHIELAMGFTAADIADCGPSILAYAPTEARAEALADRLLEAFCASEFEIKTGLVSPRDAVRQAMASAGTTVLADVQDNPGAGGTSDTTGLLSALSELGARNALVGVICDPDIADKAHRAGRGSRLSGALGGRSGHPDDRPFEASFQVLGLSHGTIRFTGDMYAGAVGELGPSCLLSLAGTDADIHIVVGSTRVQCLDRALFTHFGVDPKAARIICVKSTVHFRADFGPIADNIINVASPGFFPCDLAEVPYRKLRRTILGRS